MLLVRQKNLKGAWVHIGTVNIEELKRAGKCCANLAKHTACKVSTSAIKTQRHTPKTHAHVYPRWASSPLLGYFTCCYCA